MKKQGSMVQSKQQNKCPETKVYELPQRIQKNHHKDVQWVQKTMHEQNEDINKVMEYMAMNQLGAGAYNNPTGKFLEEFNSRHD